MHLIKIHATRDAPSVPPRELSLSPSAAPADKLWYQCPVCWSRHFPGPVQAPAWHSHTPSRCYSCSMCYLTLLLFGTAAVPSQAVVSTVLGAVEPVCSIFGGNFPVHVCLLPLTQGWCSGVGDVGRKCESHIPVVSQGITCCL